MGGWDECDYKQHKGDLGGDGISLYLDCDGGYTNLYCYYTVHIHINLLYCICINSLLAISCDPTIFQNKKIFVFLRLFISGCAGSLLLHAGFSLVVESRDYSLVVLCGFSHCDFSSCRAWALGTWASVVVVHGLSCCTAVESPGSRD